MRSFSKWSFLTLFLAIALSCNKKEEQIILNCETAREIINSDQFYRKKHSDILSPFFYIMDSLVKANGYSEGMDNFSSLDSDLRSELRFEAKNLEISRLPPDQRIIDSIWELQSELDYKNTERLISIIDQMGLQAIDSLDFECGRETFIVFVHTPDELKDKVKNTIHPELKNIDNAQYDHIMWHLNGRD